MHISVQLLSCLGLPKVVVLQENRNKVVQRDVLAVSQAHSSHLILSHAHLPYKMAL